MKRKILSILLVLSMALTLLPTAVLAEEAAGSGGESEKVAAVYKNGNDTDVVLHTTLVDAVSAAESGDTVKLLGDASGAGIFVAKGEKTLTIDLGEYTYTCTGPAVGSRGTESQAFHLERGNTITVKNGAIVANSTDVKLLIQNYCKLTLEDVILDATKGSNDVSYVLSNNFGSVNIIGNTSIKAKSGKCAFDLYYWPKNSYTDGVNVTVNTTGTITGKIEYGSDGSAAAEMHDKCKLEIKNGTFIGSISTYSCNDNANIVISGGTFSNFDCVKYMTDDAKVVVDLGEKEVETTVNLRAGDLTIKNGTLKGTANVYASGTDAKYNHLTVAYDATIAADYAVVLRENSVGAENFGSTIDVYGTLNGNIWVMGNICTDLETATNPCKINVYEGAEINAGEGNVGIALNGAAVVTVDKATISSDTGIEVRAGKLTVNGATVTGNAVPTGVLPNGNGTTTTGAGIAVAQHVTKLPITVAISDGTISGFTAFYEANPQNNSEDDIAKVSVSITGGKFEAINDGTNAVYSEDKDDFITGGTFSNSPSNYLAEGYEVVKRGEYFAVGKHELIHHDASAANCTEDGNREYWSCATCGECYNDAEGTNKVTNEEVTIAAAHNLKHNPEVLPTCGEYGTKAYYKCSVCGKMFEDENGRVESPSIPTIRPTGEHTFGEWTVTKRATYTEKGERQHTCTVCDQTYTEEIPMLTPSSDSGSSGSSSGSTTTKTETTANPDGSTTKTETKADGTTIETTTNTDGSTTTTETKADGSTVETKKETSTAADGTKTASETKVETKTDGSKVETEVKTETKTDGSKSETTSEVKTAADGTTTSTKTTKATDAAGSTGTTTTETNAAGETTQKAEAKVSEKAVETAQKNNTAVTVPIEVEATTKTKTKSAPIVNISISVSSGSTSGSSGKAEVKVEVPVTNIGTGTVAVLVKADGTEEIIKTTVPTEGGIQIKVSGDVTIKVVDNSKNFADTTDHWSENEVNFVASREIFNGVGNNDFGVSEPMTRGMVNTVLARLSGENTEGGANWYDKGNEWAVANGVSDGANPTANVTREQLATMLYRFAGSPEVSGELGFSDADQISGYAKDALLWAVQNGILNGIGNNLVAPTAGAERAQVAAMMARYLKNVG